MICLLDLETTGTNEQKHGILQIGACWLDLPGTFFRKVRPALNHRECNPGAMAVNGEHASAVDDPNRTPEAIAVGELLGWIRARCGDRPGAKPNVVLAGWNIHFDHRFLREALLLAGLPEDRWPFRHSLLDVHSLVLAEQMRRRDLQAPADAALYGELVRGADHAAEICGVGLEPRPHGALAGAFHSRRLLQTLGIPHVLAE
jgi:hypothetical protein